mmetsp:Transcript_56782/g.149406  ORF Transcript_56782/g.149406 Transcript_56782/m.149406 type:complete len:213 (-) Transcript_56782:2121-2759(-)
MMARDRFRSPLHFVHSPHERHSPYSQSTASGPPQLSRAHSLIWESALSQDLPLLRGCCTMVRMRMCSPPSQLALQTLHSPHSLRRQSTSGPSEQPSGTCSPSLGLHGYVSFSAPTQKAPVPRPYCPTERERRMMPLQEAEQALHSSQLLKMQSRGASQWVSTAQNFVSRSLPSGSLPHSLAIFTILRFRNMVPPAQVTEHGCQGSQTPHSPS